jgi:hypothetical protein
LDHRLRDRGDALTSRGARRTSRRSFPLRLSDPIVGVSALLAAYASGAVFLAADRYYAALDTSPSEVGLSTRDVIISFVSVLFFFAPLAWAASVGSLWLLEGVRFLRPLGALAVGTILFLFLVAVVGPFFNVSFVLPALTLVGAGLLTTAVLHLEIPPIRWKPWTATRERFVVVLAGASLVAWLAVWHAAPDDARRLDRDGDVGGISVLLRGAARAVCIEALDPPPTTSATNRPVVMLGVGDGFVVVRD